MEAAPRKHGKNALEFRGHLTEGVLVLARNCKDRVLLSPDDAVPEYNFISNLWNELGAQIYHCKLKKKKKTAPCRRTRRQNDSSDASGHDRH